MAETDTLTDDGLEDQPQEPDWKAEAEKWKGLSRKHEQTAKTNANAAKELETVRQQSMSETEKAVAKAKEDGKAEARAELSVGRAEDAIRFAIGERLPAEELDGLLDDLNIKRFVKEDGTVDREKVKSYVDRVAPSKRRTTDLGQGARSTTSGGDGSFLVDAIRNSRK